MGIAPIPRQSSVPSRPTKYDSGTPSDMKVSRTRPSGSRAIANVAPSSFTNSRTVASSAWSMLTPTTRSPRGPNVRWMASSSGNSALHGPHHVAHTFTSVSGAPAPGPTRTLSAPSSSGAVYAGAGSPTAIGR